MSEAQVQAPAQEAEAAPFQMPEVIPGHQILFFANPADRSPLTAATGWISQAPGAHTATMLIWSPSFGFVEKTSVRHVDDPFWRESDHSANWLRWGAWDLHPNQKAMNDMSKLLTDTKMRIAARKA